MFKLDTSTLPIIISAFSLLVSIITLFEARRNHKQIEKINRASLKETKHSRKRSEEISFVERCLEMCNEAFKELIIQDAFMDRGMVCLQYLSGIRTVLDKNLLSLSSDELASYKARYQSVMEDYEKVSGKRLNQQNTSLEDTSRLYDIHDVPQRLEKLHADLLAEAQQKMEYYTAKLKG